MLPSVRIRPLKLFSASYINLQGVANTKVLRNNLRVRMSTLKSPILRKYINSFKWRGMYPSISKCNAKRCSYCKQLCTTSTVTSSVNGRQLSVINNTDLDWKSSEVIYVLKWNETNYGMRYVGQTSRALKIRFDEHYRRKQKPKRVDNFLYRHFKHTGHSPTKVSVQPVEIIT